MKELRAAAIYYANGKDIFYYDEVKNTPERHTIKDSEFILINRKHTAFYLNGKEICRVSDEGSFRLLTYMEVKSNPSIIPHKDLKKYEL